MIHNHAFSEINNIDEGDHEDDEEEDIKEDTCSSASSNELTM